MSKLISTLLTDEVYMLIEKYQKANKSQSRNYIINQLLKKALKNTITEQTNKKDTINNINNKLDEILNILRNKS